MSYTKEVILVLLFFELLICVVSSEVKNTKPSIYKSTSGGQIKFCNFQFEINKSMLAYTTIWKPEISPEFLKKLKHPGADVCGLYKVSPVDINPVWFNKNTNLRKLIFRGNRITKLGANKFIDLKNLTTLDLSGNAIEQIEDNAFAGLEQLMELCLESNKLSNLQANLFNNLISLQKLLIFKNVLTKIHENIFDSLKNLRHLDLGTNKLGSIHPKQFWELESLKYLFLNTIGLKSLEKDTFSNLTKLIYVSLSHNQLSNFSSNFFKNSPNLLTLELHNNRFSKFEPPQFSNLKNLWQLQLTGNNLKTLDPNLLNGLDSLKYIFLGNNHLEEIPESMFTNLSNLQWACFEQNKLKILPPKLFTNLSSLILVQAFKNSIKEIYKNTFAGSISLNILSLHKNKIERIDPEAFKDLVSVKNIDFNENSVKELDEKTFAGLKKMEKLFFGGNQVEYLPANLFRDMTELKILMFAENRVKEIDKSLFKGLTKLEYLSLKRNQITYLHPDTFNDLISLKELVLYNNPFKKLHVKTFRNLRNLFHLNLDSTSLNTLPEDIFQNNTNLTDLNLRAKFTKLSNKMFSHLKKLNNLSLQDNYCASEIFQNHNSSIKFTEDVLLSCSCRLSEKKVQNFLNKKIWIGLGLFIGFFSFLLIYGFHYKKHETVRTDTSLTRISVITKIAKTTLDEYIQSSTIHGFSYISNKTSFLVTRMFWAVVVLISMAAFTYYTFYTYTRWKASPVILGFDEQNTKIYEFPFPAVTICSNFKPGLQTSVETLEEYIASDHSNSSKYFEAAISICNKTIYDMSYKLPYLQKLVDMTENIGNVKKFDHIFLLGNTKRHIKCLCSFTLSELGLCRTYNQINANEIYRNTTVDPEFISQYQDPLDNVYSQFWDIETGYTLNQIDSFPYRAFDSGKENGFKLYVRGYKNYLNWHYYTACQGDPIDIKIALHNPAEIPTIKSFNQVPFNKTITVNIKPEITKSTDNLRPYDASVRQCYFSGERQLKFFKIYTKSNCELECQTNLTLRYCNCSTFFMPREKGTPLCRFEQHEHCLEYAKKILSKLSEIKFACDSSLIDRQLDCNCLSLCNEVTYEPEFRYRDQQDKRVASNDPAEYETFMSIHVMYTKTEFMNIIRSERYGFIDFMSNCGGLMGLFMGISILSIVEILHYLALFIYQLIHKFYYQDNRVYVLSK